MPKLKLPQNGGLKFSIKRVNNKLIYPGYIVKCQS